MKSLKLRHEAKTVVQDYDKRANLTFYHPLGHGTPLLMVEHGVLHNYMLFLHLHLT